MKVLHHGVKQTLNELRSRFWCTVCTKLNSKAIAYPGHSDLPPLRFDDRHPFALTGCDYLVPLYVLPVYGQKNSMVNASSICVLLAMQLYWKSLIRAILKVLFNPSGDS